MYNHIAIWNKKTNDWVMDGLGFNNLRFETNEEAEAWIQSQEEPEIYERVTQY